MTQAVNSLLCMVLVAGLAGAAPPIDGAGTKPEAGRSPTRALQVEGGTIRGLLEGTERDIEVYRGIPYAAPPVGGLRWKHPERVVPWQGTRDCFEFGAACPQITLALFATLPEMALRAPTSEDCLYLNVWTPVRRNAQKLPVLYWIHGGGYVMGASSQPVYDGAELARLGCVVVSINYRLGLFGFLAHPALSNESPDKVSGNYGLLDQMEGLRWVRRNIAAFGGDPDRVTIFGESAGGVSVLCLMGSPLAKGLFHGAIAQSVAGTDLTRLREEGAQQVGAEQAGRRRIAALGLGDSPDPVRMRQLDVKALVQSGPPDPGLGAPLRLKPLAFSLGPNVDGHVIPDKPIVLFATKRAQPVPMIIGTTRDEMSLMLVGTRMPADEAAYLKLLTDDFGALADSVAKAYPAPEPRSIRPVAIQLATDLSFGIEARTIARAHSTAGQNTYRYLFSLGNNIGFLKILGAHHGAEVPYLFQRPMATDTASRTSRALGRYWINFAATGNPNGDGLAAWPRYRTDAEDIVDFGAEVKVLGNYRNNELDVLESVRRIGSGTASKGKEN